MNHSVFENIFKDINNYLRYYNNMKNNKYDIQKYCESIFIEKLQKISDFLKKKKIKLALETNLDVQSIIKLIKLINRKNIFIVYDTGNRLKKNNLQYKEIVKLKKYICHFHIKDKNWKGENVVLGNGKVNFDFIFKAIKHIKYEGKYTFETNRGDNPIKTMCDNKDFILKKITIHL